VVNVETIDGLKLDFSDDDWVLIRCSGTEPLIRIYAEAGTKKDVDNLLQAARERLSE
jgi:phosphoglucomutase